MKQICVFFCTILMTLSLVACGGSGGSGGGGDQLTNDLFEKAMQAVEADDAQAFESLFLPMCIERSSKPISDVFVDIQTHYEGPMESWACTAVAKNDYSDNNTDIDKMITCSYRVTAAGGNYMASVIRYEMDDGSTGLASFSLAPD